MTKANSDNNSPAGSAPRIADDFAAIRNSPLSRVEDAAPAAGADDPVVRLASLRARVLPLCNVRSDDDADPALDHLTAIEQEIIDTPATSAAGLRVKVEIIREWREYHSLNAGMAAAMLESMMADAERLAGGAT